MTDSPRMSACPSCGAAVRPDAQWCGQCYADFRPPPPPPPPPVVPSAPITAPPTAAYGVPDPDPLTQPLSSLLPAQPTAEPVAEAVAPDVPEAGAAAAPEPAWPCLTCQASNPFSAAVCTACGSPFLAAASDGGRASLVLPVVGDLGAMSRGKRLGIAAGAVVALLVPLALVTLLLTDSPDSTDPGPGTTVVETTTP